MSSESESYPRAEEALRLLAAAAGSARLYPPASAMPAEAIARFTTRSNEVVGSQGPLRYLIDPDGFRIGDVGIAVGNSQVAALAKSLHALQVGMLVIAPGLVEDEVVAFVSIANADPAAVRKAGGARAMLYAAHVSHMAVVEVSLRASEEEGLLGLDLTVAPLEDIATELVGAAEKWARAEGAGDDQVAEAVGRFETATRDIVTERVATALMRLDEKTRMKVFGLSLKADANGQRMDGMLDVIAHMKPAALARLLSLVAAQAGTDARRIAGALPLPPETAKLLAVMLGPTPRDDEDLEEAPETLTATDLAEEMAEPIDGGDVERQVAVSSPQLSASRALSTAVSISLAHPDSDSVQSIGDSLPQAARDGAFSGVREALRRLDELSADASLLGDVSEARQTLSEPAVLADLCRAVVTDADAAIAGEILQAAGPTGAEALLDAYIQATPETQSLLRPVLRSMGDAVLGVARNRLRNEEPRRAVQIVHTLAALGDRRAIPVLSQALGHLDEQVRFAAITALADSPEPEAANLLVRALGHSEPETQRFAIREIGRVKAAPAVYQLTRALEDLNVLQRTYETKKEVVRALEQIATPEAQRALKRTADRSFVWGRKSRELRALARRALESIGQAEKAARRGEVESP